ncbi:hypothetical protein M426DRAFT_264324 [Hypoxylon sp. CI-4A]|nr:hypothetical protein M426DRAFT_264324 [Hypoxylon sp. CI-4A]
MSAAPATQDPNKSASSKARRETHPILKRPVAARDDVEIRLGPGWTFTDGTYEHVPITKRLKRDVPTTSYVDQTYRSMNGLSSLQLGYKAPITMAAMDVAVEHVWRCLPLAVQERTTVVPPNGPELWSDNRENLDAIYKKISSPENTDKATGYYRLFTTLKKKPWVVWPIWVEDEHGKDWVLIVWHADALETTPDVYDQITQYVIYDPRRNPETDKLDEKHWQIGTRLDRINRRLHQFVTGGGYTNGRAIGGRMAAMPLDESTSGERCFSAAKEILGKIMNFYIKHPNEHFKKTEGWWDLSRWVNPYEHRIEMAGINAWVLMATFDYNARVTVEALVPNDENDVVVDGKRRVLMPYDLAGPTKPVLISENDYAIHPVDAGYSS